MFVMYYSQKVLIFHPYNFPVTALVFITYTQGTDVKHAGVIYDRAYSSFSELKPGMIDWDMLLENSGWFHFSAISPALNENTALVCKEALIAASKKRMVISVDLNHRAKLWQYGKQPVDVMPELVAYCDVIMGNIWSANVLLGIPLDADIHAKKKQKTLTCNRQKKLLY